MTHQNDDASGIRECVNSSHPTDSQASQSPCANIEYAARKEQSKPMIAEDGPQELQTCEHGSTNVDTDDSGHAQAAPTTKSSISDFKYRLPYMAPLESSEQRLLADIYRLMDDSDYSGDEIARCFLHASEQPPITAESLAELDMPRIINNPKLRHDVNFDRELHFRPNLDGFKGQEKMKMADSYWKAVQGEFYMCSYAQEQIRNPVQDQNEAYWRGILERSQSRLRKIFRAIRDILKTLVPDDDQKAIVERLDVSFIMREIQNGVFDPVSLGDWLATILKNHCAPMRDEAVDCMQKEIQQGAIEQTPVKLVNGLRQLLNILEAMKLDVANHQIRYMRPLLIEDTVNFLRKYNAHRISMNKIDVSRPRLWLEYEMAHLERRVRSPSHLEALTSALLRGLLFSDITMMYPQTFYLDADRLRALRVDLHSIVYQKICRTILVEMAGPAASKVEVAKAAAALHLTVSAIVTASGQFMEQLENIATEIMRIVLMLEGRESQFDSDLLDLIEARLETDLAPRTVTFERYAYSLLLRTLPKLQGSVEENLKLSALDLQDKLLPPVVNSLGISTAYGSGALPQTYDPEEDIVRRLTHIIVLHWKIWADLVYLVPTGGDDDDSTWSSGGPTPPPSASSSPTVPVAQAVYAPGRKWLPVGVTVTEIPSGLATTPASPAPAPASASARGSSTTTAETTDAQPEQTSPIDQKRQQPA